MANSYVFENLGQPLNRKPIGIDFVTKDSAGESLAWGSVESPDKRGVFAIHLDTGKAIWLDMLPYGQAHIRIHRAENQNVYIYAGNPGRFLKYDLDKKQLLDLGVPAEDASYWLGHAVGPDGRFYVGSYPATHLVVVDPATDEVRDLGRMADDPQEKYIVHPVVSHDSIVYCPVGLHHRELWAYDANTGEKKQILPEALMGVQGSPRVWLGEDGEVYGRAGETGFKCRPDGVDLVDPAEARQMPDDRRAGDYRVVQVTTDGKLRLVHVETEEEKEVETDFQGASVKIYSVSCEHEGKIYGGGFQPAHSFVFDPATGHMEDLGQLSTGTIQVYDTLSHEKGLFLSSYMGCNQDFYDPDAGRKQAIANLSPEHEQERGQQLVVGPDGGVYTGGIPIKGMLGGAVVRIDPEDFSVKVWRNVLSNLSLTSVVPVPETGELFYAATVRGGTSAIPSEDEACVMLWNVAEEAVSWQGQPVEGAEDYGRAVMGLDGLIYGLAGQVYYVFDPVERTVVHTGALPVKTVRWPGMVPRPANGWIVGLGDDAIFAIDPADRGVQVVARDPSIEDAHGMFATEDGVLYFGSGPFLMRVDLKS